MTTDSSAMKLGIWAITTTTKNLVSLNTNHKMCKHSRNRRGRGIIEGPRADLCSCRPGQPWKCYHVSKPTGVSTALGNQAASPRRKQLEARASHLLCWHLLLYVCPGVSFIYFRYSNNSIETMCQPNCLLIIPGTWIHQWFTCNSLAMLIQYLKQTSLYI